MPGTVNSPKDQQPSRRLVYLIRHGQTEQGRGKRYMGQAEYPLSERGREQAQKLALRFASLPLSTIASSDLARCLDTARPLARAKGITVLALPEFREINLGSWEGLGFDQVRARFPGEFERRGLDLTHFRTPGGESFNDVRVRVVPAYESLVAQTQGDLALVTHAGVIRVLLSHLLGTPLAEMFQYRPRHAGIYVLAHDVGLSGELPPPEMIQILQD